MSQAANDDFWKRKMLFYFHEVLDVNSDGIVNETDLETFKEIFKQMKHLSGESPMLESFTNFLNTWFKAIMAGDSNHNSSVTSEEFIKYCEKIRKELGGHKTVPDSLSYIKDYINSLFHLLDADADGFINKNDYVVSYSDFEDAEEREKYWSKICPIDSDNAKIDKNQFIELCIEFLSSSNPNDRGNWIFGLFD